MLGLAVRLPGQFDLQHVEVVGNDEIDLITRPGLSSLRDFLNRLDRHAIFLLHHESEFPDHEVGLTWSLPTAELLGPQDLTREMEMGQAKNGFGRVAFAVMDDLVARGCTTWVFDPGVYVSECLEDVISGERFIDPQVANVW